VNVWPLSIPAGSQFPGAAGTPKQSRHDLRHPAFLRTGRGVARAVRDQSRRPPLRRSRWRESRDSRALGVPRAPSHRLGYPLRRRRCLS